MKRIIPLLLLALSLVALPLPSAQAMCGHATLTSTSTVIDPATSTGSRHGLCVWNTGGTNAMSFSVGNAGLPTWLPNHVYPLGYVINDGANIERVSTTGTSGAAAPTWATTSGTTTTDSTVTWTLMTVGVAAVAADILLEPTTTTIADNNFCFPTTTNALIPGGAVSAISASGTTVAWCSW